MWARGGKAGPQAHAGETAGHKTMEKGGSKRRPPIPTWNVNHRPPARLTPHPAHTQDLKPSQPLRKNTPPNSKNVCTHPQQQKHFK